MEYQQILELSRITGLFLFMALFAGVLVYAFRPKARHEFERFARIPFQDDESGQAGD
jgi:cbb3-type cytochrome oxidase subunit 3